MAEEGKMRNILFALWGAVIVSCWWTNFIWGKMLPILFPIAVLLTIYFLIWWHVVEVFNE
jgi:hypothetical protein